MWLIDEISQLKHSDLEEGVDWIEPEVNNKDSQTKSDKESDLDENKKDTTKASKKNKR